VRFMHTTFTSSACAFSAPVHAYNYQ